MPAATRDAGPDDHGVAGATLDVLGVYRDLGFDRAVVGGAPRDPHDHAATLTFLDQCAALVDELRS